MFAAATVLIVDPFGAEQTIKWRVPSGLSLCICGCLYPLIEGDGGSDPNGVADW